MGLKSKYIDYHQRIQKNSFFSRLMKNAIVSFVGEGGAAAVTFITTILLIRLIGNTDYGILTVASSFVLIIDSFVNFQSWHAVVTFGSQAIEEKNYSYLELIIKVGSIIDFSTAILGTIISLVTASLFSSLFSWNKEIVMCIYILAFQILFNFTGTSVGVLRLLDKFKYYSAFRIVTEMIRLVLVVLFCFMGKKGLIGAVSAYALGYIFGYLILFGMFLFVLKKDSRISLHRILSCKIKGQWKKIFKFTFWTSLSSSADLPVQQFDIIFLSMISYDIVAVFKVYKQICQVLTKLTTPLKQSVMPLFSELIAKNKEMDCYQYMKKMKKKSIQLLIPFVILIMVVSIGFMRIFLDSLYIKYWYILLIYLLLRAFALSYAAIHPLFVALGEVKKNFIYTLIANFLYCVLVMFSISYIGIWSILIGLFVEYFVLIYLKKHAIEKKIDYMK